MKFPSYYSILMDDDHTRSDTPLESDHGTVTPKLSDLIACLNPDADGESINLQYCFFIDLLVIGSNAVLK